MSIRTAPPVFLAFVTFTALAPLAEGQLERLAVPSRAAVLLRTDDRIKDCIEQLHRAPHDAEPRLSLAEAYLQKMRETTDFNYVDKAQGLLREVLQDDKNNYRALQLLSFVELERHQFREAESQARQLIALRPADFRNYATLSDALMELGSYDQAADAIQKLVDLRPNLTAYNRAAHYRYLTGDLPGAIEFMQAAVRMGSESPENTAWCFVELGNLLATADRTEEARSSYSDALSLFPGYHMALGGLGKLYRTMGNSLEAIRCLRQAQAVVPLPDYAAMLYELHNDAGQTVEARRQLALIDAIDKLGRSRNENANRNLALIFADQNRNLPRALELAQAETKVRGGVYTSDALAWTLYKNGRVEEARTAMDEALRYGTPEPLFARHAAEIFRAAESQSTDSK